MDSPSDLHVARNQQAAERTPLSAPTSPTPWRRRFFFTFLPLLGLATLCFLLGAAVMFFQLPPSAFLTKSFIGARAWAERSGTMAVPDVEDGSGFTKIVDDPSKTCDGFTLFTCMYPSMTSTQALLINMKREVVYRWKVSFSDIWHNPPQLDGRQVNDSDVCIFACHLYPNGNLLVVFQSKDYYPRGCGLAMLDKDSRVLWKYAARAHHDVDVGDDGTIYALVQLPVAHPPQQLAGQPGPWLVDHVVMLSPDGKELTAPVSVLDALRRSRYAPMLGSLEKPHEQRTADEMPMRKQFTGAKEWNLLHTNSIKVLHQALAPQFPKLKAGQVLLSIRNIHTLAVLDPKSGSILWAEAGPWQGQHDAQFLDNGHMLLFDNLGSRRSARVLEYDPRTGSFPWSYPDLDDPAFYLSNVSGRCQRLPNGNTLMVVSRQEFMVEVTPRGEPVWVFSGRAFINMARRYPAETLTFMNGRQPRPGAVPRKGSLR
jgi:hypothetical protein